MLWHVEWGAEGLRSSRGPPRKYHIPGKGFGLSGFGIISWSTITRDPLIETPTWWDSLIIWTPQEGTPEFRKPP